MLQSIYIRFKSIFFSNLAAQLPQFILHTAIPCPCEGRNECTICQPLLCTTVLSIHSEDAWDGSFKVVEIYNPFRETEFFWGIQKRLLMPRNQLCHPEEDASEDQKNLYAQKKYDFRGQNLYLLKNSQETIVKLCHSPWNTIVVEGSTHVYICVLPMFRNPETKTIGFKQLNYLYTANTQ